MKLNLFKILHLLQQKFPDLQYKTQQANAVIKNNKTVHELWHNCSSYGHNIEHNR